MATIISRNRTTISHFNAGYSRRLRNSQQITDTLYRWANKTIPADQPTNLNNDLERILFVKSNAISGRRLFSEERLVVFEFV